MHTEVTAAGRRRFPGLLRVLVLFHESEHLGAGTAVLRCVPGLKAFGWTATGWLPGEGPLTPVAASALAGYASADRPVAFSRRGWNEPPGVATRLVRTPAYLGHVRRALLRFRPHVVHANTLLTLPEAAVARQLGLPLVVHVHEHPPPGRKRAAALTAGACLADVLVGVAGPVTDLLRSRAGSTPVLTVHNGVPATDLASRPDAAAFIVGTVGTVSRTKGTDVFFEAARVAAGRRPGLRFEHVGAPNLHRDEGLDARLASLAATRELEGSLSRLGPRPAGEVLPRWSIFVSASRSEAFPLATLEAMALGIPVVATAVGGVPEQIVHLESGILVPTDDPSALADWIVRLADDAALRERLGAAGAERVRDRFTLDRQAAGLHAAYLTALVRRHGPGWARREAAG